MNFDIETLVRAVAAVFRAVVAVFRAVVDAKIKKMSKKRPVSDRKACLRQEG